MKLLTKCKPFFASISSGIVAICMATPAIALPTYSVLDLGTLGGRSSSAAAINNYGQVVGYSYTVGDLANHATLFSPSGNVDLGALNGQASYALGINDSGQIVGLSYIGVSDLRHSTLFSPTGNTDLGTLGGNYSGANSINNSGQIVGFASRTPENAASIATLFSPTGNTDLGTLGGPGSSAWGINNTGQIVGNAMLPGEGSHATLFSVYGNVDLGTLGGDYSGAAAINDSGQIVGSSNTVANMASHATLFSPYGNVDLGGLDANLPSWAAAINSSGQIVGGAYSAYTTYIFDALIWEGGVMRTLDSLIDPASGWDLISANDINDMGQIAATGVDGNGNEHALLLTPISRNNVPEPATGLLIGTALFGLFATRRRVNRACHNSARSTPRGKSSTPIAVELIRPSTSPSRRIVT